MSSSHASAPYTERYRGLSAFLVRQLAILSVISACTAQKPQIVSTPIPSGPNAQSRSDSLGTPVRSALMIYQPGDVQYSVQMKSIVRVVMGDSIPRVDSSHLTAVLSAKYLAVPQSRFVRATVVADSVALSTYAGGAGTTTLPNQSYSMDVDPTSGRVTVARSVSSCSQDGIEGPFHGDEVVPTVPSNSAMQFWADTTNYSACRGGVALRFTRVSNYQRDTVTVGTAVEVLARIVRTTEVLIAGSGSQWQQPVEASGHGTAVDTLVISVSRSRLQSISGSGQLEMNFKSALRSQRFTQATTTQIMARPNAH
jgi:hypothetical protein